MLQDASESTGSDDAVSGVACVRLRLGPRVRQETLRLRPRQASSLQLRVRVQATSGLQLRSRQARPQPDVLVRPRQEG